MLPPILATFKDWKISVSTILALATLSSCRSLGGWPNSSNWASRTSMDRAITDYAKTMDLSLLTSLSIWYPKTLDTSMSVRMLLDSQLPCTKRVSLEQVQPHRVHSYQQRPSFSRSYALYEGKRDPILDWRRRCRSDSDRCQWSDERQWQWLPSSEWTFQKIIRAKHSYKSIKTAGKIRPKVFVRRPTEH